MMSAVVDFSSIFSGGKSIRPEDHLMSVWCLREVEESGDA